MQHRNLREDALEDSAASLRMAGGILRELVEAGAVDGDPTDLASLLATTYDEVAGISMDLGACAMDMEDESAHTTMIGIADAVRAAGQSNHSAEATRILRLTEKRLAALARLIDGAADEPFTIE
jgi:hypothetical protein